jgi:hypothetical protein
MANENKDTRTGIINAISTPIQLAALIVLVVEGLLAFLLSKANANDISLYVGMMVGILVLTIVAVFIVEYRQIKLKQATVIPETGVAESAKKTFMWDVFLAAPMASITDEDFPSANSKIKEIKRILEEECDFKRVFYAGNNMSGHGDFDSADVSVDTDINAIKESRIFILIYPEKIVSSVLYEAGIALALGKPSFYFGKSEIFPFLMREANNKFSFVKIHESSNIDDIIRIIKKNRNRLFEI